MVTTRTSAGLGSAGLGAPRPHGGLRGCPRRKGRIPEAFVSAGPAPAPPARAPRWPVRPGEPRKPAPQPGDGNGLIPGLIPGLPLPSTPTIWSVGCRTPPPAPQAPRCGGHRSLPGKPRPSRRALPRRAVQNAPPRPLQVQSCRAAPQRKPSPCRRLPGRPGPAQCHVSRCGSRRETRGREGAPTWPQARGLSPIPVAISTRLGPSRPHLPTRSPRSPVRLPSTAHLRPSFTPACHLPERPTHLSASFSFPRESWGSGGPDPVIFFNTPRRKRLRKEVTEAEKKGWCGGGGVGGKSLSARGRGRPHSQGQAYEEETQRRRRPGSGPTPGRWQDARGF